MSELGRAMADRLDRDDVAGVTRVPVPIGVNNIETVNVYVLADGKLRRAESIRRLMESPSTVTEIADRLVATAVMNAGPGRMVCTSGTRSGPFILSGLAVLLLTLIGRVPGTLRWRVGAAVRPRSGR